MVAWVEPKRRWDVTWCSDPFDGADSICSYLRPPNFQWHIYQFKPIKKALTTLSRKCFFFSCRDGEIRTHDPLHPIQVHYLAVLHPETFTLV